MHKFENILRVASYSIFISLITLIQNVSANNDCQIADFSPSSKDLDRLESGLVGEWNDSFNQKLITIKDIDGNSWDYAAIEKKPAHPDSLLLFIHGFPEFSWAWEQQIEYFGEQHHAVAIDLKGHHYSSSPDDVDEYDFLELAWEIRTLVRCLGYSKVTLIGHDFGGAIAWIMGMLHPDIVDKLIIINAPHPYLFGRNLLNPNSDQAERSYYIDLAQSESTIDNLKFFFTISSDFSIFESGFYNDMRFFRLLYENWLPLSRWRTMKHYYRALPYPPNEQDYPAELTSFQHKIYSIKRPTLLLWGEKDPYFTNENLEGLEDLVPELKLVKYPEGTHWLHHEATDLNLQIKTFIEQH